MLDLVIDGNYILQRNVFSLYKNNLLFGALYKSLEMSISNYRKMFPFSNIYFVSDSREKSWRKDLNKEYKAHRKNNSDIDWEFVFSCYNDFKNDIRRSGYKVLECPQIEGDDFISFIVKNSNSHGRSTLIISNDYDIKQMIRYNTNPLVINIMSNEMFNKQKIFLPKNYQIFFDELNKINIDDIFNLNDNTEFISLINSFLEKYQVNEIDYMESLMIKVISGDQSDNILSIWNTYKNGRRLGIGEKGAKSICDKYVEEFGEMDMSDPDLYENIADLVCERKKLNKSTILQIKDNIKDNMALINLDIDSMPIEVKKRIKNEFEKI